MNITQSQSLYEENNIKLNIYSKDKILNIFKRIIAHYLKNYYRFNILGKEAGDSNVSMDEPLFAHKNKKK